jgi:hypothetical protein
VDVALLELGTFQSLDLSGDEGAQPVEAFKPIYARHKPPACV